MRLGHFTGGEWVGDYNFYCDFLGTLMCLGRLYGLWV